MSGALRALPWRGAGGGVAPLWQQRRQAALAGGAGGAAAPAADQPPPLTLEELLQQVLGWHLPSVLRSRPGQGGPSRPSGLSGASGQGRGPQGLPTRFASLAEYTGTFRWLLMEELRAHLQQSQEESPLPLPLPDLPGSGGSGTGAAGEGAAGQPGSGGGGEWAALGLGLGPGAERLSLVEVQRRSHFYHLELEEGAAPEGRRREGAGGCGGRAGRSWAAGCRCMVSALGALAPPTKPSREGDVYRAWPGHACC